MSLPIIAPARAVPLTALSFGPIGADAAAVEAANPLPVTPSITLEERLMREGEPYSISVNNAAGPATVTTGPVNTVVVSTPAPPSVGRVFYVETARYSLDQPAAAQFAILPDGGGRFSGLIDQQLVAASQVTTLPVRQFLRASEFSNGSGSLAVRNNLTAGSVAYRGGVTLIGRLMTDDLNFGATAPILVAGDSISAGTGATRTAALYHFGVRDWLIGQGHDCRLILKAKSGSNSSEHETWRAAGWHRPAGRPRMGWYALGTNDAAQNVAAATFVANLGAYWSWWRTLYPTAPLVVLTPPPLVNATYEANAVTLRTAAAAYVAAQASPLLRLIDLGAAWTATDATRTTDGIHPNDSGHAVLRDLIIAQFQAQAIVPA